MAKKVLRNKRKLKGKKQIPRPLCCSWRNALRMWWDMGGTWTCEKTLLNPHFHMKTKGGKDSKRGLEKSLLPLEQMLPHRWGQERHGSVTQKKLFTVKCPILSLKCGKFPGEKIGKIWGGKQMIRKISLWRKYGGKQIKIVIPKVVENLAPVSGFCFEQMKM